MTAPPARGVAAAPARVVRAGSDLYRVCFVCTANICRSPMAASVFRTRVARAGLDDRIKVSSGGTGGWFEGEGADLRTVAVLAANGYPDDHSARQFKAEWFVGLDLVVALDESHARYLRYLAPTARDVEKIRLLRSFDPAAGEGDLGVPDPYYGTLEHFQLCLEMVETASDGLLEAIRPVLGPKRKGAQRTPKGEKAQGARKPGTTETGRGTGTETSETRRGTGKRRRTGKPGDSEVSGESGA